MAGLKEWACSDGGDLRLVTRQHCVGFLAHVPSVGTIGITRKVLFVLLVEGDGLLGEIKFGFRLDHAAEVIKAAIGLSA